MSSNIPGANSSASGNVLVSKKLNFRIFLATFCQDTWLVGGHVDTWLHIRLCQFLFPEPLLHVCHVLLHGVEGGLGPNLVGPPDVNPDDGMLELEVLHRAL